MTDIAKIRGYIEQNQKIIRFMSSSVSIDDFDEEAIRWYNENAETIQDYSLSIDGFRSSFADAKNTSNNSLIEVNTNGINLCVKGGDLMNELKTSLAIDGNAIRCITKRFLVDTDNLKITENSLTFTGEINGLDCTIGRFSISGDTMTGGDNSSLISGTINCKTLDLKNAIPELIDCNPDGVGNRAVKWTSNKRLDTDEKEDTGTVVSGYMNVVGNVWATEGWNDKTHGTPFSLYYDILDIKELRLVGSDGSYTFRNRLRCSSIYSEQASDWWSDERLKEDIEDIDGEKAKRVFQKLKPSHFTMKGSGESSIGYIAQEVDAAFKAASMPSIVEEQGGYLGVRYTELMALRVKLIQENQKKIEELRKRGTQ